MSKALSTNWMTGEQDRRISEAFGLERARLLNFIRRRVADENDNESKILDSGSDVRRRSWSISCGFGGAGRIERGDSRRPTLPTAR
jgi:hypothetical protein